MVGELAQSAYGRLVHDLFDFPKVATIMGHVRSLPAFKIVFAELEDFEKNLPPVKSNQVTIRGNREVLRNLRKSAPRKKK